MNKKNCTKVLDRAARIKKITEGQWWGAVLPLVKHAPKQHDQQKTNRS